MRSEDHDGRRIRDRPLTDEERDRIGGLYLLLVKTGHRTARFRDVPPGDQDDIVSEAILRVCRSGGEVAADGDWSGFYRRKVLGAVANAWNHERRRRGRFVEWSKRHG